MDRPFTTHKFNKDMNLKGGTARYHYCILSGDFQAVLQQSPVAIFTIPGNYLLILISFKQ